MTMQSFTIALLIGMLSLSSAAHGLESCSCLNLESLQEELQNALYEQRFFSEMAETLKAEEDTLLEAKKDPTHPDSSVDVMDRSLRRWEEIMVGFRLPHMPAKGYKGPEKIDMKRGTCAQPQSMLDAMRDGSQCREIADITLEHEAVHRKTCTDMGVGPYWARLPSALAAEEAERYRVQADQMRKQLKRVIDEGTVTVEAELEPRVTGPQFDVTYSYVMPPMEMRGKSSAASDTWTMNGRGKQTGKIARARIAGMNCTASGQLNDEIGMTLETDGLSMSLDGSSKGEKGDVYLRCNKGFGMSLRPDGEMGSGEIFADRRVELDSEFSQDVRQMDFGKLILQNGLSVTGKHTVKVKLVCPGN